MSTFAVMQARIANELARNDLTAEIKDAIKTAITQYQSQRFWFNTSRATTLNMVVGQRVYTSPSMSRIDEVVQTQDGSKYTLDRIDAVAMDLWHDSTTKNGKPIYWTWIDNAIHVWPTPDGTYETRLIGILDFANFVLDGDTNAFMVEGEYLIRSCAKKYLYGHVIMDDQRVMICEVSEQAALSALRTETHKRMPRGKIQATQF